jgi:hypothetical protein
MLGHDWGPARTETVQSRFVTSRARFEWPEATELDLARSAFEKAAAPLS